MKTVKLDSGKYTIVYDKTDSYPVKCPRHGEEWRDLLGDNLLTLCKNRRIRGGN